MEHLIYISLAAWLAVAALAVSHILLNKRDPRGAALWIVITLLVLGSLHVDGILTEADFVRFMC